MLKRFILAGLLLTLTATAASAQATVFLVRHAERADSGAGGMASDPSLSEAGRARAESLAAMLKDTKLTAIFRPSLAGFIHGSERQRMRSW